MTLAAQLANVQKPDRQSIGNYRKRGFGHGGGILNNAGYRSVCFRVEHLEELDERDVAYGLLPRTSGWGWRLKPRIRTSHRTTDSLPPILAP